MTSSTTPTESTLGQEIAPPFKNVSVELEEIQVEDPTKENTITMSSGSIITIPANAFVDKNGQPITSPVKLTYREFFETSELIASGIPMRVANENGGEEWMQTAGMFELQGFHNDEKAFIADGKSVEVSYASEVEGNYDFWYFDETTGSWENRGATAGTAFSESDAQTFGEEIEALKNKTSVKPVAPPADD
ncbi:MAG: hypothetical protein AAF985_00595, partial [Bacteroidota bacterium]